jgi:hypothetical protein
MRNFEADDQDTQEAEQKWSDAVSKERQREEGEQKN